MTEVTFRKVPPGSAYSAPSTHRLPDSLAKRYVNAGYAAYTTKVLPIDIPHRDILIAMGIETVQEILDYPDLTKVKGIGKKIAADILAYCNPPDPADALKPTTSKKDK